MILINLTRYFCIHLVTLPYATSSVIRDHPMSFPRRCFISDDCIKDLDGVRLGIEYIEMRGYHASNAS